MSLYVRWLIWTATLYCASDLSGAGRAPTVVRVEAIRRFQGKRLSGFVQKPYTAATLAQEVHLPAALPPGYRVYLCDSKLKGWIPVVGLLYHRSVVICPPGECPILIVNGQRVCNPRCDFYGTCRKTPRFALEDDCVPVRCRPVNIPADTALLRIKAYSRPYRLLWNNCHRAAREVTR